MTIIEKLLDVQLQLKAPKGQYNSFGKYKYRSCEDILEAVKPLCGKNKAAVYVTDDVEEKGGRIYIKATAHFADAETEKEITVSAYAREEENKKGMDGSQVTGASSSYARKYALNGLFAIDDTKDSDSTNTHGNDTEKAAASKKAVEEKKNSNIEKVHENAFPSPNDPLDAPYDAANDYASAEQIAWLQTHCAKAVPKILA
ncbi:MAG: ERF family protein, partial [Eubacteriales bacterium]